MSIISIVFESVIIKSQINIHTLGCSPRSFNSGKVYRDPIQNVTVMSSWWWLQSWQRDHPNTGNITRHDTTPNNREMGPSEWPYITSINFDPKNPPKTTITIKQQSGICISLQKIGDFPASHVSLLGFSYCSPLTYCFEEILHQSIPARPHFFIRFYKSQVVVCFFSSIVPPHPKTHPNPSLSLRHGAINVASPRTAQMPRHRRQLGVAARDVGRRRQRPKFQDLGSFCGLSPSWMKHIQNLMNT